MTYGSKLSMLYEKSAKELLARKTKNSSPQMGYCDLETECDWNWNETYGFKKVKARNTTLKTFPNTDSDNSSNGHFLWFKGSGDAQIWSKPIPRTGPRCRIEFWLYMVEMEHGFINLVIKTSNSNMTSIAVSKSGNNSATWKKVSFPFSRAVDQPFRLVLEAYLPTLNSSIGVDNIRLVNCFPESIKDCTQNNMFRCNNGSCLNRTHVCDFTKDCADGEDEDFECDKIPENAKCNFEDGWCGWTNVPSTPLNWTRHSGPTPTERTGPNYDHTYHNETGVYAYVNMGFKHTAVTYGSRAIMTSPLYNPTPPYNSDPKSSYYRSCQVRFFYHKHGVHTGSLGLFLVQVKPYGNHTENLWWSYGTDSDAWYSEAVALGDIKYRYHLQFEASRGYSSKGDIAVDDISLSPECFGLGVPRDVVGDFNYYNPIIESEQVPPQHPDFGNETVVRITTCGASGRDGPTVEQCAEKYNNNTDVELFVPPQDQEEKPAFNLNGVQRWTVPRGEYYTLIAVGARGGKGSSGVGDTLGAFVRGIMELQKGEQLYFMMGQEGTDACTKNLGLKIKSCQSSEQLDELPSQQTISKVKEVKKIEFKNPGGGGGGATAIFRLKANGNPEPLLIAGGGGGLGLVPSMDSGLQHGRGSFPSNGPLPSSSANVSERMGGLGASWNGTWPNFQRKAWGTPLIYGGIGGLGCQSGSDGYGNGGFGGGGGGCQSGGGGGGYIGGNAGRNNGNGEGGYSYANQRLANVYFKPAAHSGPGEVFIIPAISGCGCDYRCVALDPYLSETKCLCPQGWLLSNNSKSCIMIDSKIVGQQYIGPVAGGVVGLLVIISGIVIYKRYQKRKELLHHRQAMFGNGTELAALRSGYIPNTMITEFNPNYEFAGILYSCKDLQQIPRECITLVKPLGQGAFGQVYQGVYKCRRGIEQAVAIKTLLPVSTEQAEVDFKMEALIMSKFNHHNIVHFIGVCFDRHPLYIILELLAGGDLKNFLHEERPRSDRPTSLTMLDLVMCGFDVANGCKYLEDHRFIHRDIAARNCLLTTKAPGRTVKIADFGMARDIYKSGYYRKGGSAKFPVRWMSPESFMEGIFSIKADVWAFGVLLWEIMSFGYKPYLQYSNTEVVTMVKNGTRLEQPTGCPDPIYGIMMQCWRTRPDNRPSFATIVERLGYCLQDPDVINKPIPSLDIIHVSDSESDRPDLECNVHSELDGCGYLQPRIIDPQSVARRVDQAMGAAGYDSENEKSSEDCRKVKRLSFEQVYAENNDEDEDDDDDDNEDKCGNNQLASRNSRVIHRTNDSEECNSINNGNNRPEDNRHETANVDNEITDRKNGNESTTTTDTNSDSLIVQSSDTPPDTITNSSPNTRTCSPSHMIGLNANVNNVNGMVKKNSLKATLSLDPSALCRNTGSYEKITTRTQRSSTPGSMELRKGSLGHELPREEECSC
ncbi:hypothetical protein PUN28_006035 [Cardiocondyla obscurior]